MLKRSDRERRKSRERKRMRERERREKVRARERSPESAEGERIQGEIVGTRSCSVESETRGRRRESRVA